LLYAGSGGNKMDNTKEKHKCGECSEFDFCLNEMQMKRLCSDGVVRVVHRKMEACSDFVPEQEQG